MAKTIEELELELETLRKENEAIKLEGNKNVETVRKSIQEKGNSKLEELEKKLALIEELSAKKEEEYKKEKEELSKHLTSLKVNEEERRLEKLEKEHGIHPTRLKKIVEDNKDINFYQLPKHLQDLVINDYKNKNSTLGIDFTVGDTVTPEYQKAQKEARSKKIDEEINRIREANGLKRK